MLCKEPGILKFQQAYKAATWGSFKQNSKRLESYFGEMVFWIVSSKLEREVESICLLLINSH